MFSLPFDWWLLPLIFTVGALAWALLPREWEMDLEEDGFRMTPNYPLACAIRLPMSIIFALSAWLLWALIR